MPTRFESWCGQYGSLPAWVVSSVSLSAFVDIVFVLLRVNRPSYLSTWTEAADGIDTVVRPVSQDTLLRDVVRAIQPLVRIQILIQDPPNAAVSDSTSELLSPSVVLL